MGTTTLEIRRKKVAVNQCYWCKEIKTCPFEMLERGNWVPICRACKRVLGGKTKT